MEHRPTNPYFDKVIIPKEKSEHRDGVHAYLYHAVIDLGAEKIPNLEIAKTPEDIQIIQFVEQEVDTLLEEYGRKTKINVSTDNIHVVPEGATEDYTEGKLAKGGHDTVNKQIIIDRVKSDTEFALILFHEFLHLKCFSAVQLMKNNTIESYRTGISSRSKDGEKEYWGELEEAIIAYLTEQFYKNKIQSNERFQDEKPIISRQEELKYLNHIVDEIFEKNKNTFSDREEVLKLFIDAQINGNLFTVARLIKETFGLDDLKELPPPSFSELDNA